jgi:hypothetical protein
MGLEAARGRLSSVAYAHHERLSGLDASFLGLEDANCHMHIGAVAVFEGGASRVR